MEEIKIVRDVTITSKYIPILAEFIGYKDIRYYLGGIFVTPHPKKGVFCVATDGHTLCVIHDELGSTNGDYICSMPAKIVKACSKKETSRSAPLSSPKILRLIDDVGYVLNADDIQPLPISQFHSEVCHAPIIDGKFPSWEAVVPRKLTQAVSISLNVDLLLKLKKAAMINGYSPITIFINDKNSAQVIRTSSLPEMMVLVMPMRADDVVEKEAIPSWISVGLQKYDEVKKAA